MLLGCIFVLFLFLVLILGVPGSPHVRDCIQQDSVVPAVEPCKARSQPSPLHMADGVGWRLHFLRGTHVDRWHGSGHFSPSSICLLGSACGLYETTERS